MHTRTHTHTHAHTHTHTRTRTRTRTHTHTLSHSNKHDMVMINIVNIGYISFWQLNMACCTVKCEHHTLGFCGLNIATGRGSLKCLRCSIYFAWNVGKCCHKQPPYELPGAVQTPWKCMKMFQLSLKWQLSQTSGQINCTCTRTPCPWGNFIFCLETGERRKGIIKWICHMYNIYIYTYPMHSHFV